MRFTGIDIPQGAIITAASIQFQTDETDSVATSLEIRGQDADDTATFTSEDGNISSRPVTAASVDWAPAAWTSVGEAGADQRTPDLSQIIQEIVDRPGWASGNAMAIIVTGTGERTAESYNGSPSSAPLLHIEFDANPNTPPVAVAGANTTAGDVPLTVDFSSAGSSDPNSSASANPSHTYTSAGLYTATLTVTDDGGAEATADVLITVNGPPTTHDVSAQDVEDTASIAVALSGSDAGGTVTAFTLNSVPANGTLYADADLSATAVAGNDYAAVNGVRTMYFVPFADWSGVTGFDYSAKDNDGLVDPTPANATITVTAVNDRPGFTAGNPPAVPENSGARTVPGWVTGFDPGAADEAGQGVLGYIVGNIADPGLFAAGPSVDESGTLSYTPAANATGSSSFEVQVRDDGGVANGGVDTSAPQSFTITVNDVNDLPVAVDDTATTSSPASGNVLLNDDQGDAPATVTSHTDPSNGSVSIDAAGDYTYTPDPGFDGIDSFTYTITDANGDTSSATVTITVTGEPSMVDVRVATGNDDAEERQSGTMYLTSSDLELVDDGSRIDQTIGMRFTGIDIPQGAIITAASIQFQTDETDSVATSLRGLGRLVAGGVDQRR
jgi:VCBS repeat-containing protein